jgi:multidrug efflux pump subunit AcrA (membrane-fusion protein)
MFDPTDDKHITANVTFSFAANQTFKASFKDINTVADNKTGSYRIRLTLPQPDNLNILPGMSAEVGLTLTIPQTDITQQLPKAAVMVEDDKYWVWRITPSNQLEKTYVFLDEQFNIIAGLQDADRIVAAGGDELSSHQVVKPWTKEKGL